MKFSFSSTVFASLIALCSTRMVIPTMAQTDATGKESIDLNELIPVGDGVQPMGATGLIGSKPMGSFLAVEPFQGYVYFEVHPSTLAANKVNIELFAGVTNGNPCSSGVLLESTADNPIVTLTRDFTTSYPEQYADLDGPSYPATSNGAIGGAYYNIKNFRLPTGDKQIYFPNKGDKLGQYKDGQVELCIRLSTKNDYNGDSIEEYYDVVDFQINYGLDLTANTASFQGGKVYQAIDTANMAAGNNATAIMKTYICDYENQEIARPFFTTGDDFGICVGPEDYEDDNYSVNSFENVICENKAATHHLIKNFVPDEYTSVDSEATEDGVRAVRSKIPYAFIAQGEKKFICRGDVVLSYQGEDEEGQRRRRRLVTKRFQSHIDLGKEADSPSRMLYSDARPPQQESTRSFETPVVYLMFSEEKEFNDDGENTTHFLLLSVVVVFAVLFTVTAAMLLCKQQFGNGTTKKKEEDTDDDDEDVEKASATVAEAEAGAVSSISQSNDVEDQAVNSRLVL